MVSDKGPERRSENVTSLGQKPDGRRGEGIGLGHITSSHPRPYST